ncbi:unnamed protein product [Musa textilis]
MAKVHSSPKYVPILTDGGEEEEYEEANPFRWMIEGFSTLLNHTAVTHRSGNFAACGFTWNLQLEIKSSGEDDEKCLYLYLFSVEVPSSTSSVVKATYELLMYDQLYGEHLRIKGDNSLLIHMCINLYPIVKPYLNVCSMFVVLDKFVSLPSETRVYVDYKPLLCGPNQWQT